MDPPSPRIPGLSRMKILLKFSKSVSLLNLGRPACLPAVHPHLPCCIPILTTSSSLSVTSPGKLRGRKGKLGEKFSYSSARGRLLPFLGTLAPMQAQPKPQRLLRFHSVFSEQFEGGRYGREAGGGGVSLERRAAARRRCST